MGSIYRRGHTYWIKYYRAGRPYRESTASDKITEAKRFLQLREGQVVEGRFPGLRVQKVLVEELARDYLRENEINGRKSLRDAQRNVRRLAEAFGGLRVPELTSEKIAAYIEARHHAGLTNASINRELAALRRMLTLGARQQPPKVLHLPPIPRLKERNIRTGFYDHDEFLALRGALPDHQKLPCTIGYWTGMRKGEILNLRWDQLDLDRSLLRLDPGSTKSDKGRLVPLVEDLLAVLTQWRLKTLAESPSCPWICHYRGQKLTRLTRAWGTALQRVGLEGKLFHDLRRTGVRNMVRAGISERVAMQISGHKTRSVFDRYDIVSERDLRDAAERLNAHSRRLTSPSEHDSFRRDFDRTRAQFGHISATGEKAELRSS